MQYGDFSMFKMAAAAILNFENFTFLRSERSRVQNYVIMPNFVKIARTAVQIFGLFKMAAAVILDF